MRKKKKLEKNREWKEEKKKREMGERKSGERREYGRNSTRLNGFTYRHGVAREDEAVHRNKKWGIAAAFHNIAVCCGVYVRVCCRTEAGYSPQ